MLQNSKLINLPINDQILFPNMDKEYSKTKKYLSTAIIAISLLLTGCQSAYYNAMEKVSYHKRDIMVDRIEDARESQREA